MWRLRLGFQRDFHSNLLISTQDLDLNLHAAREDAALERSTEPSRHHATVPGGACLFDTVHCLLVLALPQAATAAASSTYRLAHLALVQDFVQVRAGPHRLAVDRRDDVPQDKAPVVIPRGRPQALQRFVQENWASIMSYDTMPAEPKLLAGILRSA